MTAHQQNIAAFPAFARLAPRLVAAGYSAVPIGAGAKYPVGLDEWQHYCENQPSQGDIDFFAQDMPAAGVGLPNGRFTVAYDFDHQAAVDAVFPLMPWTPVAKIGQKGFTLIYRQNPDHRELPKKFKSKRDAEGKRHMLVEVLSTGSQTVLPPTMHPDTQRPYAWCNPWGTGETHPLWDIPLAELPTVPAFLWSTIERRLLEAGLIDDPFAEMEARAERLARAPKLKAEFETMRHRLDPWLEKRITAQADNLAKLTEGRHDALYRAACAMGPFVGAGLIEEAKVETALFQACLANGFFDRDKVVRSSTKKEFHRQFERGIAWGETQPLAELEERYSRDMPPAPTVMSGATVTSILRAEKASDILARKPKPRKWAVDQWIPGDNVTLLVGDGGTGKSLLVLLLLACIATGTPFFGIPVVTGPALYISAEDEQDEIDRRVHAIHARTPGVDLSRLHCISLDAYPEPAIFAYDARGKPTTTALLATIEAEIIRLKPKVVALDPLADLYACDEVKRPEVRAFISALRRIARAHQCAIILLAHPSVEGMKSNRGYSGSTAWNNSVRSRLLFGRPRRTDDDAGEDDDDWRELSLEKSNRSKIGGRIKMKWVDGVFIQGADTEANDQLNRKLKAEAAFVALLHKFIAQHRPVSDRSNAANYAPKLFAEDPEAMGITRKGFESAMNILFTASKISVEESGPQSRKVRSIVIV